MKTMSVVIQILCLVVFTTCANAEFYEDRRCSCVCPGLDIATNTSKGAKTFYQDNHVSPEECNCNDMVLPRIANKLNGSKLTYCIQCDCHFETRNTTIVMIVVVSLLAVIAVLMLYMACLQLLRGVVKSRKTIVNITEGNDDQLLGLLNRGLLDNSDDDN